MLGRSRSPDAGAADAEPPVPIGSQLEALFSSEVFAVLRPPLRQRRANR
jgi:hypothetical protein